MKYALSILAFVLGMVTPFAQHITVSPVPDWVVQEEIEISSTVSKYDVNSGAYFELLDYQYNLEKGDEYTHETLKILSYGGVKNGSEIYISYDTAYQSVEFHYLYIHRKDQKLDRTAELTFELLNQEQELGIGLYSGQVTAYDILEDIRVDDRIEFAYTIKGQNPIYENKLYYLMPLEYDNPVDYLSLRFTYPKNKGYSYDCSGCQEAEIVRGSQKKQETLKIVRKNIEAIELEETTPPWYIPFDYFLLSGYPSWGDVNTWATEVFKLDKKPDLTEVFEEVLTGAETEVEKIDAVLNYVQNDIRYMGIESGIGSIKPFPPMQVVKQRFGDCKDKSLLAATLLHELGVETCYPALVSSGLQETTMNLLPGGQVFDHVILYIEYKDTVYWIDPTTTQQGGTFTKKKMPDYGYALVVKPDNNELTKMNLVDNISRTELFETFTFSSFAEPCELVVETKLYGQNADYMRSYLEYYSINDFSDQLKDVYSWLYNHIEVSNKLKIEDDFEGNVITLTEYYTIYDAWQESEEGPFGKRAFPYEPVSLYNYMNMLACDKKQFPVYVRFPANYKQITTINLPEELYFEPSFSTKSNAAFYFSKGSVLLSGRQAKLIYSFKSKKKEISAEEYATVCAETNDLVRDFALEFYYPLRMEEAAEAEEEMNQPNK